MMTVFPILVSTVAAAAAAVTNPSTTKEIWVTIDHARFYEAPVPVSSIVVGNPAVADVTVRSPHNLVLFGKLPGSTSITLFDNAQREIATLSVRVRNPSADTVTLQAGITRYTYSCTTVCEQVPAIGDGSNGTRVAGGNLNQQFLERNQRATGTEEGPTTSLVEGGAGGGVTGGPGS